MAFRDLFRKPDKHVVRAVQKYTYAPLYDVNSTERIGYGDYQQFAEIAYKCNSCVFALVNKRMNIFAEATFKFRDLKTKKLFGNQDLSLLETPWPNGTTGDLLSKMLQDVDLCGNAYIVNRGEYLERLRPDCVMTVSEIQDGGDGYETEVLLGYIFDPTSYDNRRNIEFFTVDEVAHWAPIPDPCRTYVGMSWLTPVIKDINADTQMSDFRDAFFKNAATPNIVIRYPMEVKPDQIKEFQSVIAAKHTSSENAFKTMVLGGGADLNVVGADMAGTSFDALQGAGETRIAAAAGVPPIVAGFREGSRNSEPGEYADAVRSFIDLTMRPLWRSAVTALSKLVTVPAGSALWYDDSDIAALQQGERDKANTVQVQSAAINTLIMAGYEADSVVEAVNSGDLSLLVHSGLISVQMHPPGQNPPPPDGNSNTPDPNEGDTSNE